MPKLNSKSKSKSKLSDDDYNSVDHIPGTDSGLDIDLTESADRDQPMPDLVLGSKKSVININLTNLDSSNALVTRPQGDLTVRGGTRHLSQMFENKLLDVHDFQERKIVHPKMDNYEILNTYREIRTELIHKSEGKNLVVMMVSLQHGMGTTFNAVNLAAAFSYEGEKTSLIVDCDVNRRKLGRYFPDNGEYGLTDYLVNGDIGTEKIIYPTGISRMRYIPVGSKHQEIGEFFSTERMRNFIEEVKRRYSDRYIILNAPPIEASVDAAILSEISDFIIFILPYGKISNDRLSRAMKLIPKEKIIGFVINNKINHV